MSFLKIVAADLAAVNKQDAAERQAELAKCQLLQIISKLLAVLAGTFEALVDESTERILRFIRLGGLAEHEDVFRRFFTERPDQFFIYSFVELWEALKSHPDLQDFIGEVYYRRGMDYVPKVDGNTAEFPWAVKGTLSILKAAGADSKTMTGVARELIAKHHNLLSEDKNEPIRRLLLTVEQHGNFIIPKPPAPVGMKTEDNADPSKVLAKDAERPRQSKKKAIARQRTDGKVPDLRPTAEDEQALAEYKATNGNGHAANHALAALGTLAAVPDSPATDLVKEATA
jgi:hypothetical protein